MDFLQAVATAIILLAAVSAALGVLWRMWGRPVQGWFLAQAEAREQRLLRIEATMTCMNDRITQEFANGVDPADPAYVPLRKALEAHLVWSSAEVAQLGEHLKEHP